MTTPAPIDAALLRACRRGNDRAAARLHALTAPAMLAHARAILGDPALAEDAVQSAFLRILRQSPRTLKAVRDVRAWMATLVRNEALMLLRSRRREAQRRGALPSNAPTTPVDTDALRVAMAMLPRFERELVALRHAGGLQFDQIAAAVGRPRSTVAARYQRAVHQLRDALADLDDAPRSSAGAPVKGPVHHAC